MRKKTDLWFCSVEQKKGKISEKKQEKMMPKKRTLFISGSLGLENGTGELLSIETALKEEVNTQRMRHNETDSRGGPP